MRDLEESMRTGSELNKATKPFTEEDRAKSWRVVLEAFFLHIGLLVAVAVIPQWWVKLPLALLAGLVSVRVFITFHDYCHGAIFRNTKAGSAVMSIIGFYMLTVKSVWRETHNYHHKNNAKLIGSSIGSFPVITLGMWNAATPNQRRLYRFMRHPLTIFGGYFTVFLIGMSISPFRRKPKVHWGGVLALLLHFAAIVVVGLTLGWLNAFFVVVLPLMFAHGVGAYLFFVQHNFPDMQLKDRRSWDYTFAALRSSSMFDMPKWMHWLTGNIGYHHIHHLNHRIPFYRLPEAMAALPELQVPGRTTWRPADVAACLRLAVWDPKQEKMLTYGELEEVTSLAAAA